MERISIQLPAALYTALYTRYEEDTGDAIEECLRQLLGSSEIRPVSGRRGTATNPRPGAGTITGKVWDIADQLLEQTGSADRDSVMKACINVGININTANTQYSY